MSSYIGILKFSSNKASFNIAIDELFSLKKKTMTWLLKLRRESLFYLSQKTLFEVSLAEVTSPLKIVSSMSRPWYIQAS